MCKAKEYINQIASVFDDMNNYSNELKEQLQHYDLMQQDILHQIENSKFNAYEGYCLAKSLKKIREERRNIKNELATFKAIGSFKQCVTNRIQNASKIIDATEKQLNKGQYHPRVLKAV